MSTRAAPRPPRGTLHPRQRGVTLVELVMFIVIVSVALAGIVGVMNLTTARSADPLRHKQALMIAEGLLEEVRLAGFTWCDPGSSTADEEKTIAGAADCARPEVFGNEDPSALRPFDNINDYASAPNTAQAAFDIGGVLSDAAGRAIAAAGYTARLTLVPETLNGIVAQGPGSTGPADVDVLRIRVEVDYGAELPVVLETYRTRYAPEAR